MNDKKGDLFEDLRKKYTSKKFILSDEERKSQKEKALNENAENDPLKIFSSIDLPVISLFDEFSEPEFTYTEDKFFFRHILVDGKSKYKTYNYGFNYIEKENVLIEIDKDKIRINDEIHLNSDLIAFRFSLGRDISCNRYELAFLNKEEEEIKFVYYRDHNQGLQFGPFKREPSDKFYPIWNQLLETVEKFIVPHILRFVIDNIRFGNSYLFGSKPTFQKYGNFTELKVILEGAYLTGKIMFIEKEILISWNKLKLEYEGENLRVSATLPAIERKLLKKSDWNVMIFPTIKEYFIKYNLSSPKMINPFKKGLEYNNLAKSFNAIFLMIQQIKDSNPESPYEIEDLYALAYIARRGIIDKIEKYKWNNLNIPITVPSISSQRISLYIAMQNTLSQVISMAEESGLYQDVKEILDKGELYYEVEKNIPDYIKNLAFEK